MLEGLESPAESREVRFGLDSDDFRALGSKVLEDMEKWVKETSGFELVTPNYEGVRVNYELDGSKGWFLLRKSLHDPVMPMNIESYEEGGIDKVMPLVRGFLRGYEGVMLP